MLHKSVFCTVVNAPRERINRGAVTDVSCLSLAIKSRQFILVASKTLYPLLAGYTTYISRVFAARRYASALYATAVLYTYGRDLCQTAKHALRSKLFHLLLKFTRSKRGKVTLAGSVKYRMAIKNSLFSTTACSKYGIS